MSGVKSLIAAQAKKEKEITKNMETPVKKEEEPKKEKKNSASNPQKKESAPDAKKGNNTEEREPEVKEKGGAELEEKADASKQNDDNGGENKNEREDVNLSIKALVQNASKAADETERLCMLAKEELTRNGKNSPGVRTYASGAREHYKEITRIQQMLSFLEATMSDSPELKLAKAEIIVAEKRANTASRRALGFLGGVEKLPMEKRRNQRSFTISDEVYYDFINYAQDGERNGTGTRIPFSRLVESALKEYVENHEN